MPLVPEAVERLVAEFGRLPGVGPKTAQRLAFYCLRAPAEASARLGAALESLEGVFGAHTRSARLALGSEAIVLTQYLAPRGRPIPLDTKSNDRAFQHVAIVVDPVSQLMFGRAATPPRGLSQAVPLVITTVFVALVPSLPARSDTRVRSLMVPVDDTAGMANSMKPSLIVGVA